MNLENRLNCLYNWDPTDEILAEITDIQLGLNLEADQEEFFWEQWARVNWLKNGDRNTSYFHQVAIQRQVHGRIKELEVANGESISTTEKMLNLASKFFGDLFSASEIGFDDRLFGLVEKRVTTEMNALLIKQFTEEDITYAVNMMAPLKAPGIDGFPAIFFQRYWHLIGSEISSYSLFVLNGHYEMEAINKTRIVLIPKVDKPKNLSHFRPISLCNVVYKIIAKTLVHRMSAILGSCINENKGAFISGRHILENVLIAYEVLHSMKMKKKVKKGNFALKLDMSKTYDRVEWDFLEGMMTHLGFLIDWIVFIMRCVCSVSSFVSLNGSNSEWFSPSRGLRQGDPLSPYLFLICVEGFSTLINEAKQKGLMRGASVGRERLSINHLFFSDDCILFRDASNEGAQVVQNIIKEYEILSGQRVNFDKSLIYFGASRCQRQNY